MNREQQIAQVITDLRDYAPTSMTDEMVNYAARQIVATLLPQVTTMAEIEALPSKAVLINRVGSPTLAMNVVRWNDHGTAPNGFPYTVVWQTKPTEATS